jgi:O-antigen ligase
MAAVVLAGTLVAAPVLSANLADRYLSIVSANTRNAATASGRIAGELQAFSVAARRPVFGHGLGTSREANANFTGADIPAHILYGEVAEELGYVGLALFLAFLAAIAANVARTGRVLRAKANPDPLDVRLWLSLRMWLWMNLIFSFASYGLSEYEWYFAAGLSEVLRRGVAARGQP